MILIHIYSFCISLQRQMISKKSFFTHAKKVLFGFGFGPSFLSLFLKFIITSASHVRRVTYFSRLFASLILFVPLVAAGNPRQFNMMVHPSSLCNFMSVPSNQLEKSARLCRKHCSFDATCSGFQHTSPTQCLIYESQFTSVSFRLLLLIFSIFFVSSH